MALAGLGRRRRKEHGFARPAVLDQLAALGERELVAVGVAVGGVVPSVSGILARHELLVHIGLDRREVAPALLGELGGGGIRRAAAALLQVLYAETKEASGRNGGGAGRHPAAGRGGHGGGDRRYCE